MAKMRVKLILTRMNLNNFVYTQSISENNSNSVKNQPPISKNVPKNTVLAKKRINLFYEP